MQASLHLPQLVHFSGFITATLFSIAMASFSQAFTHIPQAMQEVVQTLTTFGPLWQLAHKTRVLLVFGTIDISDLGQTAAQAPQPAQISSQITTLPSCSVIAPNWHAETQSPRPMQPN